MEIEKILKKNPNTTFYIGSSEGSSFFFIGNYSEWQKRYDKINKRLMSECLNRCAKAEGMIPALCNDLLYFNGKDPKDISTNDTAKICAQIDKLFKIRAFGWVDLADRAILKRYPKEAESGEVLIIQGYDAGKFWFKSEYDKVYNRRKAV